MSMRILTVIAVVFALSGLVLADNVVDVEQTAAKDNQVLIDQGGDDNVVTIEQIATTGYNWAGGKCTTLWGPYLNQTGSNNKVAVYQHAAIDNGASIDQLGSRNQLIGAVWGSAALNYGAPAKQISTGNYNALDVFTQGNDNKVGVNMYSSGINEAYIWQEGSGNIVGVRAYARNGDSLIGGNVSCPLRDGIVQNGDDNLVWLKQDAGTGNTVNVEQSGNGNKLVGAAYCGDIEYGTAAYQYSANSYNHLDLEQLGGGNTLGLYQENAGSSNSANVSQLGGGNSAGVYQYANTAETMGNTLWVNQTGGDTANVCQIANAGYNNADINQ